ncbi:amino acid adenylation protein [Planctomycetota bacterium]|nr:amino acid adenylation protein [Planctomycetota bacterium]
MLMHDLFAAAVARHGGLIAVDVPPGHERAQREVTRYQDLAAMAAQVAQRLAPLVKRECVVAVLLPRESARLYAAQLGVLQSGAAYVCLDPSFPVAHREFIVRDSTAVAVVTNQRFAASFAGCRIPVILIEDCLAADTPAVLPRPVWLSPQSLAYVIYTSGTTGNPKGVLIEHRGVVNLITADVERFGTGPGDRCAQGSSPAYDSSVEEAWLALAAGATVVVLDDAAVRLGPDLVEWLRTECITVFCPPPTLLRAMDCKDPRRELPDLRLAYVGGEAMPQDLTDLWSRALWLENGYGPTECTVTVVRGRLQPGMPVIIGVPVPFHEALLLNERDELVAAGEVGELCIAGIGLARGYLGQPGLTAAKFPQHPQFGRIYRTGDLARRQPDGQLVCLGRMDAQVKIRGYRIELEAIESALVQCAGVREAACRVQLLGGIPRLAAFLVAEHRKTVLDMVAIAQRLRSQLPDYMVPVHYALLAAMPRTVGGKLDRRALPEAEQQADVAASASEQAIEEGGVEARIAVAFATCIGRKSVAPNGDFFELGGDSLRAAQLISKLRRHDSTAGLAVRDVYEARTIAGLVARAGQPAAPALAKTRARTGGRPMLATLVHFAWLMVALGLGSGLAYLVCFAALPALVEKVGLVASLVLVPVLSVVLVFGYAFASLWFVVWLKELLIGRYRSRVVPVFSTLHIRHWVVVRAASLVPWPLLQGTALHAWALRSLGAHIGKRVYIHRGVNFARGGWDLLTIEDDVVIGREAHLDLVDFDDGQLIFGPVHLGARCVIDVRAGIGRGVVIGEDAFVGALSHVAAGTKVGARERFDGVPARHTGPVSPTTVRRRNLALQITFHAVAVICGRTMIAPVFTAVLLLGAFAVASGQGVTTDELVSWLWHKGPLSKPAWAFFALACTVCVLPLQLVAQALVLRWARKVHAGTTPLWSRKAWHAWLRMELVESAGLWLSGTLFWPMWLRLAGARIGRNCEISTILDVLPEHLEIGAECFLADGIYLGSPRLQSGAVTFAPVRLGNRTFLGNHVVIHAGQSLPDDLLIGVSTVANDQQMHAGSSWFGSPPLQLPRREVVVMDRRLTHEPNALRYLTRLLWEVLRFALPVLPLWLALYWFDWIDQLPPDALWSERVGSVLLATLVCVSSLAATVLVTKWLLLGRVRPGQHALWSGWASRWDFHYVLWQRYGRGLLSQLEETFLLSWFLRAIGMRIGRGCVLGEGFAQVVDPDMLTLEDGCTVHALFQAHSFEDRVLKIDRVHIGRNATVGRGTVVLYGADIGEGAHVAPHSVVMKHEVLPPNRRYIGSPLVTVPAFQADWLPASQPRKPITIERDASLDVARGLAVLGMIWMHFVPSESGNLVADMMANIIYGKAAVLFAVLAGMTWATHAEHRLAIPFWRTFVWRRTAALALSGFLLWRCFWPTEILLPFALMFPVVAFGFSRRKGPFVGAAAILMLLVPIAMQAFGQYVAIDCYEDGSHLADREFGFATLRYFLFDGSYPLLPWLCFPMLGAALVAGDHTDRSRNARWVALALPLALVMHLLSQFAMLHEKELGWLSPHLQVSWQPTSLPFVLQNVSIAIVIIASLSWWRAARGLPRWLLPVGQLGRASLTHYLLHIMLVFVPLRWFWPDEDWPLSVGIAAAVGYVAVALPVMSIWFRKFRRGPFEMLLGLASGR